MALDFFDLIELFGNVNGQPNGAGLLGDRFITAWPISPLEPVTSMNPRSAVIARAPTAWLRGYSGSLYLPRLLGTGSYILNRIEMNANQNTHQSRCIPMK